MIQITLGSNRTLLADKVTMSWERILLIEKGVITGQVDRDGDNFKYRGKKYETCSIGVVMV